MYDNMQLGEWARRKTCTVKQFSEHEKDMEMNLCTMLICIKSDAMLNVFHVFNDFR